MPEVEVVSARRLCPGLFVLSLTLAGCSDAAELGEACNARRSCADRLGCVAGRCRSPCAEQESCGSADLACEDGYCQPVVMGEAYGPCYPNGTCNVRLACSTAQRCLPSSEIGAEGGACYANGTCDDKLSCDDLERCASVADPCAGQTCSSSGACQVDSSGGPACSCAPGFHSVGLACLPDADPCAEVTCSYHGVCATHVGGLVCACDRGYYPAGLNCVSDSCIADAHANQGCEQGDLWWFDSCGGREELVEDCAGRGCEDGACLTAFGPGEFVFAEAEYAVGEGASTVPITVVRRGGTAGDASIEWRTLAASATIGLDYGSFSWRPLIFPDGVSRRVEVITIVDDATIETDETFRVLLRNPTGGATLGLPSEVGVTIIDDDVNADPCASVVCANHGTCILDGGQVACQCDLGYREVGLSCLPPGVLPVFPGAAGPGTSTPAGRGGAVLRVTNLDDSGAGSLRAAIGTPGARIIVFEVSGYIDLASSLRLTSPYVTIAGQTAPSPGICLRHWGLDIVTHDVLVQHLAIRPGNPGVANDGLQILGPAYNVVIDHVSATWATDENMRTWYDDVTDITFSNNLIAEGLLPHSMGLLLGAGFDRVGVIRNVLAHNNGRNPRLQCGRSHDAYALLINNLIYNHYWDCAAIDIVYGYDHPIHVTGVANVAMDGPETRANEALWGFGTVPGGSTLFSSGDTHYAYSASSAIGIIHTGAPTIIATPDFDLLPYGILIPGLLLSELTADVGSRPADRDPHDQRILDSIAAGEGQWISAPAEVGGFTPLANNVRSFDLPADANGDSNGNGYSNIEELLFQMAASVEN